MKKLLLFVVLGIALVSCQAPKQYKVVVVNKNVPILAEHYQPSSIAGSFYSVGDTTTMDAHHELGKGRTKVVIIKSY